MRTARRTTLAALTTGLIIALLPTAADACDGWGGWGGRPGHDDQPTELTAVYVYRKVDPAARASWQNSGEQRLILVHDGLSWTDSIDVSLLPDEVCGDGWAIQEDQIRGLEQNAVPTVVDRRTGTGVLTWPVLVDARHRDLSRYVAVPECEPVAPVTPPATTPPVTPPATTPPVTPPATTPPVAPVVPPETGPVTVPTVPVVVGAAAPAQPVLAAPSFAG